MDYSPTAPSVFTKNSKPSEQQLLSKMLLSHTDLDHMEEENIGSRLIHAELEKCTPDCILEPGHTQMTELYNFSRSSEHTALVKSAATETIRGDTGTKDSGGIIYIRDRIKETLELYVSSSAELLKILGKTRSIISGSVPLAILTGGTFVPHDLDIYVPASQEETMLNLLELHFGCTSEASSNGEYADQGEVSTIRWMTSTDRSCKLNIMTCRGESAITPIFHFHSTLVMNFISVHGLYCAYPKLTGRKLGIPTGSYFEKGPGSLHLDAALNKYRARGFEFIAGPTTKADRPHICYRESSCPRTIRTIYDGAGMFIGISPEVGGNVLYDNVHSTLWSLGGRSCGNHSVFHGKIAQTIKIQEASFDFTPAGTNHS
ncbi:hypothetical protein C8J57DRAFT_1253834 [Mycena rebaudengoi]|nr:hypothetical protein C8J57DRAFT_1253834 [Mycena rebaudengoi]